jgi:hypothetical protein
VRSPQQQNLSKVPAARNYAMSELRKSGVEFHSLSDDQLAEWKDAGGYQRSPIGTLQGRTRRFDGCLRKLEEAASTMGRYYVHDA